MITATSRYNNTIPLPQGYTNPSHPSITPVQNGAYTVDILTTSIQDPSDVTAAGNMVTEVQNNFTGTQAGVLNLDTTATIQVNLTIESITRMSTGDDTNKFTTGNFVYRIAVTYNRT